MKTNKILIASILLAVGLSACVSKKKYLDMESSRMRAEQRVRELTDENEAKAGRIAKMIADYETMKKRSDGQQCGKRSANWRFEGTN